MTITAVEMAGVFARNKHAIRAEIREGCAPFVPGPASKTEPRQFGVADILAWEVYEALRGLSVSRRLAAETVRDLDPAGAFLRMVRERRGDYLDLHLAIFGRPDVHDGIAATLHEPHLLTSVEIEARLAGSANPHIGKPFEVIDGQGAPSVNLGTASVVAVPIAAAWLRAQHRARVAGFDLTPDGIARAAAIGEAAQ